MTHLMHVNGLDHSKKVQKQVSDDAASFGGKFEDITDKGAVFAFETEQKANSFRARIRTYGVFADEISDL